MNTKRNDSSHPTSLSGVGLGLLLGAIMLSVLNLARHADDLAPHVGDIVSFEPGRASGLHGLHLNVALAGAGAGQRCVLDTKTMAAARGSLIIEQANPHRAGGYLVHWAGGRTADGHGDCGASAELRMNAQDITAVATMAGGFGVGRKHAAVRDGSVFAKEM